MKTLEELEDEIVIFQRCEISGGNKQERERIAKELRKIFKYKLKVFRFSNSIILNKTETIFYE